MVAAAAAIVAAVVAASVTAFVIRRSLARRVGRWATRLDPDASVEPTNRLPEAIGRLERAADCVRVEAAARTAAFDHLQMATDALPVGVVVAGPDDEVLLRNAAATRFVGVRHADALVSEVVGALLRDARLGHTRAQTLDLYGPPSRTVLVRAVPVGDAGGDVAIVLIEDVTDRVRLEAMRTDFVANLSHELRTPVGALALLAETMVDEDQPALMRRLAEKMVLEANRVARIIEDLLELSRLEHDGMLRTDSVGVGLLVAEAVDRVRLLADQRGIKIVVDEPSRRLAVTGDRRQLVSALANLVENGVKYSDAGSVVEVSVHSDGRMVGLVVRDHGIGIPARDQDRIFERFYRVDRARSRDTGGTGLGLAIVRHVASNHGGTVAVESTEGEGSTFTIRIPAGPGRVAVTMPEEGLSA